jgi:ABC-2 type transport system ATP-binding protein
LDSQVFILDSTAEMATQPVVDLENVSVRPVDSHSFEVTVSGGRNINEVFAELDKQNIHVSSMRNKTNRLEELFLSRLNAA